MDDTAPGALGSDSSRLFTPAQQDLISRARTIYEGAGGVLDQYGDISLGRILVSHDWKLENRKCVQMLESIARWRNETSSSYPEAPNAVRARLRDEGVTVARTPHALKFLASTALLPALHQAKNGDVMTYAHLGAVDPEALLRGMTDDQWCELNMWMLERGQLRVDMLSAAQARLARIKLVQDLDGAGLDLLNRALLRRTKLTAPLQDRYYPCLTSQICAVNAPWFVDVAFSVIKPLLSRQLQNQIHVVGRERAAAFLQTVADTAELPSFFGGERVTAPELTRAILGFDALEPSEREMLLTSDKARKYREWVLG